MRNIRQILISGLLALVFTVAQPQALGQQVALHRGTTEVKLAWRQPIHWVSIEQIQQSLADKPPQAVGFDIDDTLLFSSPGFWRGQLMFSPGKFEYLHDPAFWEKMNNGWDDFSLPKQVGEKLVAMHLKRGDKLYFITARDPSKTESVSKTIQTLFHVPADKMHPVIFANGSSPQNTKKYWIKHEDIQVYYGDSDSDITEARAAGARGIRVLRAANSTYQPLPQAGALNEEVIVNSQY